MNHVGTLPPIPNPIPNLRPSFAQTLDQSRSAQFLPYGTLPLRLGCIDSSSRCSCVWPPFIAFSYLASSSRFIRCARSSLSLAFFALILSCRAAVLPPPPALL